MVGDHQRGVAKGLDLAGQCCPVVTAEGGSDHDAEPEGTGMSHATQPNGHGVVAVPILSAYPSRRHLMVSRGTPHAYNAWRVEAAGQLHHRVGDKYGRRKTAWYWEG